MLNYLLAADAKAAEEARGGNTASLKATEMSRS